MASVPVSNFPVFDFQGHRGCRGLLPENTLPAMMKAIELGVTTLEMDVVISQDLQPVLSHEPFFHPEISTRPDGSLLTESDESNLLFHLNYNQIKTWDVGLKPHPRFPNQDRMPAVKPLLKEVLLQSEAKAKQMNRSLWYNIETKSMRSGDGVRHPAPAAFVRLLMTVIKEVGVEDRVVIQSFDERTLQVVHQQYPSIKTALLIEAEDTRSFDQQLADLGFKPFIYSPAFTLVTPRLVQSCHSLGMKVIPWTVNSVVVMKQLQSMGVDGLISDYPNLYAELR